MHKATSRGSAFPVADEHERLQWLDGRVPAPEVVSFVDHDGEQVLVTRALPGRVPTPEWVPASQAVAVLAEAVSAVHRLDPTGCPFRLDLREVVATAERHVASGGSDADYCHAAAGLSPEAALAEAIGCLPDDRDPVVLHGDAWTGNLLVAEGAQRWWWVDWGWCGVGPRDYDLAGAFIDLRRKYGDLAAREFLHLMGASLDADRLRFYELLDAVW